MKILVTGGAGYVGSKLVNKLKEEGHQVDIFDKKNNQELSGITFLAIGNYDIVYHLAALAEIAYTDEHPQETYNTNIGGLNNLCEACALSNAKLIFTSTSCIYGEPQELPSKEDSLINPTDTYAMSKASGEYLVKMWHLAKGLEYVIVRLGTIYGQSTDPKMRGDMCIQKFTEAAVKGELLTIKGTGAQNRNFLHIDDAVDGFISVLDQKNQTFNMAGAESISIEQIAYLLEHISNKPLTINYKEERKDDFRNQNVSIWKIKQFTGWQPRVRFSEGLRIFYEYTKDNLGL